MLATFNNCLAIFASNREFVLCVTMTQRHANKGAQQMAVHRLSWPRDLQSESPDVRLHRAMTQPKYNNLDI